MFFGYPAAAVVNNWLHEVLVQILEDLHGAIALGQQPKEWPESIPVAHRPALRRKWGVRDRVTAYQVAFAGLTGEERALVHNALFDQNRLAELLDASRDCEPIDELPGPIRAPAKDLFEFSFELLVDLEIRDQHYKRIHDLLPDKICPFCGLNAFDPPGGKREDYDHYLPESKYPFAGTNLWNLVPMCKKCNGQHKLATDPLWDGNRRRKAVNPYGTQGFELSVVDSTPFSGTKPHLPRWIIRFVPDADEAETWDQIFALRRRLEHDVFDDSYTTWIKEFACWCITAPRKVQQVADVPPALDGYAAYLSRLGRQDRSFLKLAVCRLHQHLCAAGNERVLGVLLQAVQYYT